MSNFPTFTQVTDEEIKKLSNDLFTARRDATILQTYPGPIPATLEQAYAVQDLSIEASDDEVVGWKIGMVAPELRSDMGSERIMGPVFKQVHYHIGKGHAADEFIELPVFEGGFIAVEPELMIEVAEDIEPGSIDTAEGVEHLVKTMYAGVEIASSPVVDLNDYGPTAIITDNGNQQGMIVGAEVENWKTGLADIEVKTVINGEVINTAPANNVLNGQLAAFAYLIDCCALRGIKLPAGTLICSGAITGVHETVVGATSTVSFGEGKDINMKLVAIK